MNLLTDLQPHSSIEISRNMFHVKHLFLFSRTSCYEWTGTRTNSVTLQTWVPIMLPPQLRFLKQLSSFWIILRRLTLAVICFTWNVCLHFTGQVAMNWRVLAQILWLFKHEYLQCFPRSTDFLSSSAHFESYWAIDINCKMFHVKHLFLFSQMLWMNSTHMDSVIFLTWPPLMIGIVVGRLFSLILYTKQPDSFVITWAQSFLAASNFLWNIWFHLTVSYLSQYMSNRR